MGRHTLMFLLLSLVGCGTPVPCPKDVEALAGHGVFVGLRFNFVEETEDCPVYAQDYWIEEERE